jgi:phosphoribosyl 1,2-cyclic phosphodiesterase
LFVRSPDPTEPGAGPMKIAFYGVRGSIPVPGPGTIGFGGNTSCVHIRLDCQQHIVLDAGTGIRILGAKLIQDGDPILLLLSHRHWDHIMGFPFFAPIYQDERAIRIFAGDRQAGELGSVLTHMDGASFPVRAADLPARLEGLQSTGIDAAFTHQGAKITTKPLNHPGSGCAFRIEENGVSVVYATDNELDPPYQPQTEYDAWVEFCRGADLLIHDAQYIGADLPRKLGWGHSLVSQARQLALDAQVKTLALFHHDPDRTDRELMEIEAQSARWLKDEGFPGHLICAWEGLEMKLDSSRLSYVPRNFARRC